MKMNSKTLKVTGAVVLSVLLMIIIVIYTPKPVVQPSERQQSVKRFHQHLLLVLDALSKAIAVDDVAYQTMNQFTQGEKVDLNPLIEAKDTAISALSEANQALKQYNEELQRLSVKKVLLKSLIDANTRLSEALSEVSNAIITLTENMEPLNQEKMSPSLPNGKEVLSQVGNDRRKTLNAISQAHEVLKEVIRILSKYYKVGPIVD